MDAGSILAGLKLAAAPAANAWKWTWRKIRHAHFRWRDKSPLLDEVDAIRAARSALGGSIISVVPFRNLGSKNVYLAVLRKSSDEDFDVKAYVLEKVGGAYISRWMSDVLDGQPSKVQFIVADIDKDGSKEIAFEVEFYGTGYGSRSLFIYSLKRNFLAEVTEHYNSADAAAPAVFPIEIKAGDDEQFRQAVLDFAHARGLLQGEEPVDYDLPQFAVQRWLKENGEKRAGRVRVYLYPGAPPYASSVNDEVDTGEMVWTAYFKGPLCAYHKDKNKHFIAYAPRSVYEWPKSLAVDGRFLWFICHCIPGLFSFECETNMLRHFSGYAGTALPDFLELWMDNGRLVLLVEEDRGIIIHEPNGLMECEPSCRLNEQHIPPAECYRERHREDLGTMLERVTGPRDHAPNG